MKSLAVTFFTAIAIISLALIFDVTSSDGVTTASGRVGKTILTRDSQGRVTSELTFAIDGKKWEETVMKQLSYYDNKIETVTYKKADGVWNASSKVVTETEGGKPVRSTFFQASQSGKWIVIAEQKADDLSNNEVVDDLVFDSAGNLVMKATYAYRDGQKVGLQKEEYGYENNKQKMKVFYAWNGNSWSKTVSAKVVAE